MNRYKMILGDLQWTFHRFFDKELTEDSLTIYNGDWSISFGQDFVALFLDGRSIAYAETESLVEQCELGEYFVRVTELTPSALDSVEPV